MNVAVVLEVNEGFVAEIIGPESLSYLKDQPLESAERILNDNKLACVYVTGDPHEGSQSLAFAPRS